MVFKVTQKNARGTEIQMGTFQKRMEAEGVIQKKLSEDALYKLSNRYYLYEGMDVIQEYDQSDLKPEEDTTPGTASGGGQGQSQSFRPTPFSTTPQPKGMPRSWVQNDTKNEEDDKS